MRISHWIRALSRILPHSPPQPERLNRRVLKVQQLEDRTMPSVTLLPGAPLMQPTYQLYQASTRALTTEPLLTPAGLDPAQIRAAYGFDKLTFPGGAAADGSGETIAIVDAFDDPTVASDLTAFDQQYGLRDPSFVKVGINAAGQASTSSFPTPDPDWSIEIALDVEWSHAIAPGAGILLVEAHSNSYADLLTAVDYARNAPDVVGVSMSWGGSEFAGETAMDSHFTTPAGHPGVTFFASAGDSGSPALTPSVSAHVVSVGGTSLEVDSTGDWLAESGWSGGGGGISSYVGQPGYQKGLAIYGVSPGSMRAAPDVSYNADPDTGVAILSTYGYGGWLQVGGTSAGAPQWAALMAIADQGRALAGASSLDGYTQTLPALYKLPSTDFHDIVVGDNGYLAGPGYDLVTGLGSPVANYLIPDLIGASQVLTSAAISPGNATVGDGDTLQLSALTLDQFGRPMLTQPVFTWSLINGSGTLDANGLYTAPAAGSGTDSISATATVDGVTWNATTVVTYVPALAVTSINSTPSVVTGTTCALSAAASDPSNGPDFYFWYVSSSPAGSAGPLFDDPGASTTTATFFQPGQYTLGVFAYDLTGASAFATVDVTVVATLSSVEVTPLLTYVPVGGHQQFAAQGFDQFYEPVPATITWSIAQGPGTISANGLYSAPAAGLDPAYIQASASASGASVSGDAYVILLQPPIVMSIQASPNPVTRGTLTAAAYDPNGAALSYRWTLVSAPGGAKAPALSAVKAANTGVTFYHSGTYTFQVAVTDSWGMTTVATVTTTVNPVLTSLAITPTSATVRDGVPRQFTASAFDQFHVLMTAVFTWSRLSGPGTINSSTGLYTPPSKGSGTAVIEVTASAAGVKRTSTVKVILQPPPAASTRAIETSVVHGILEPRIGGELTRLMDD